jgi:adenylate kinase family enzyme
VRLIQREDDTREVIERRQKIYSDQVREVLDFFEERDVLCQFEPQKGVADYPQMLETIVQFVNKTTL